MEENAKRPQRGHCQSPVSSPRNLGIGQIIQTGITGARKGTDGYTDGDSCRETR